MSSKEQQQRPQKKQRQQRKHILNGMKQRMKHHAEFDNEQAIRCCIAHIERYIVDTPCTQMNSRKTLKTCRCLADARFMHDGVIKRRLACSMMWWAGLSLVEKRSYFRQWVRYAADNAGGGGGGDGGRQRLGGRAANNTRFFIPDIDHSDVPITSRRHYAEFRNTRICQNALASLFGFSRFFVSSALSNDGRQVVSPAAGSSCAVLAVDGRGYYGAAPRTTHHLTDKRGNESVKRKNRLEMYHSMTDYLKQQMTQHAPINDDDDNHTIYLPPHVTKRQLYNTWCFERGWKPTFKNTAKGCYNSIHLYAMRDYDDDTWPEGSVYKDICTWGTFQRYWTEKFPNLATSREMGTRGREGSRDMAAIVEMNDVDDSLKGVVVAYDNGDDGGDDYNTHDHDGGCREDNSYDDNISVGDDCCFNGIVPRDSSNAGADPALLPTLFCDIPM